MNWDDIKITDLPTGSFNSSRESSVYHGTVTEDDGFPDWTEDAYLAHGAYSGDSVDGYTIDPELSDDWSTVYVNNNTKKATVAFAGTGGSSPHESLFRKAAHLSYDVASDVSIAEGDEENSWQFQAVDKKMEAAIAKYGRQNIHTTGHSLGGTKAIYASSKYGVTANAFNPGFSPFDITNHTRGSSKWDFSRSHAYVVPGDPVAAFAYVQPGLKVTTLNQPEKLKKVVNDFQTKSYEAAAGVSMAEILAAIHPVAAGAYAAAGIYTVGKDVAALHSANNFLGHRTAQPILPAIASNLRRRRRGSG